VDKASEAGAEHRRSNGNHERQIFVAKPRIHMTPFIGIISRL